MILENSQGKILTVTLYNIFVFIYSFYIYFMRMSTARNNTENNKGKNTALTPREKPGYTLHTGGLKRE